MTMSSTAQALDYMKDKTKRKCRNADDTSDDENVEGKIIIITGCNTGIGKQTLIGLAKKGATIILACRDTKKAEDAAEDVKKIVENAKLDILKLDLGDLASIRQFVDEFKGKYDHLNILINNAGFMDNNSVIKKTKDGFENHMQINYLGPFLLTTLLIDHLKKGAPARIVCIQSSNLVLSKLDFDDLMMEKNPKFGDGGKEQYNNSKLASGLVMTELAKKLRDQGIDINVYNLCPGFVKTDVFKNDESWLRSKFTNLKLAMIGLTPEQGAETSLYCTLSKTIAKDTGKMYRFCAEWENGTKALHNEELSKKMWDVTHQLLDIKETEKL